MIRMTSLLLVSVAALALASCNNEQQVKTVTLPCQCSLPPQASVAVPVQQEMREAGGSARVRYSHHAWRRHRSSYAYGSSSTESETGGHSYGPEDEVHEGFVGERGGKSDDRYSSQSAQAVWTDGYGHRHYDSEYALNDGHKRRGVDDRARLAPWHGYDPHDGPENGY